MSETRTSALLTETPLAPILNGVLDPALAARVMVEINPRARRISVRVDPARSCVVLVYPRRAPQRAVAAFIASRAGWIAKHLEALPSRIAFTDGAVIPYGGRDHVIRRRPEARGGVWREGAEIMVAGRPEHTARRVRDWLKNEARHTLTAKVHAMAARLGVKIAQVSVRDTVSRWGSCNSQGRLSFSWRLMLAPEPVLTYVAAHEVAHLKHMDHSRTFWRTVMQILEEEDADPTGKPRDWKSARQWLRRSGTALHRYG